MKKKLFFLVLLLAGLCSTRTFAQTPVQFNNQMCTITDSLYKKGQTWGTKLTEVIKESKEYDKLQPVRIGLLAYIDDETSKLNAMTDVNGSYQYRQAVLTYLQFEKQFVNNLLKPFELYTAQTTTEVIKEDINKLVAGAGQEKDYLEKVRVEQEAFAKANNFTIQKPGE